MEGRCKLRGEEEACPPPFCCNGIIKAWGHPATTQPLHPGQSLSRAHQGHLEGQSTVRVGLRQPWAPGQHLPWVWVAGVLWL
jgi:hypothetical protein